MSQSVDGDKLTMIDVIPAAVDVPGEAEESGFSPNRPLIVFFSLEESAIKGEAAVMPGMSRRWSKR